MIRVEISHALPALSLNAAFEIAPTGVTALFGPSGAGKTTLINALAGLLRPQKGRMQLGETVLLDTAAGFFLPPHKRRLGLVFQDARLFPHLSVEQNLLFGWRRAPEPADQTTIEHTKEVLKLGPLLKRMPATLSGGERQRVALGRALLSSPRLLLLDEPLASLDAAARQEILGHLEVLRDEMRVPMLYVSHNTDEVARLADDVLLLEAGRIAASGSVFELFSSLTPETRAFGGSAVVRARLERHMPEAHLSVLTLGGQEMLVPPLGAAPGDMVRLRIFARDVTLALDAPQRISANNVLTTTIGAIQPYGPGHVLVQLKCGEAQLVAEITTHSLARLGLSSGMSVYAIIKSVTIDRSRPALTGEDA